MIDNEILLAYALDGLEPAERDDVRDRLTDDTAARANLSRILQILKPLEADANVTVPSGLIDSTLARLPVVSPRNRVAFGIGRWVELALAASIGLVAFGVVASAIGKLQADKLRMACQNNLRDLSVSLNNYADTHNDKFPQAGVDAPTAGEFASVLDKSGQWPTALQPRCAGTQPVGYTYALGHRMDGQLIGPRRQPNGPPAPIAGDFPSADLNLGGSVSPHGRGQNLLFADGVVRYSLMPTVNGDHVYLNDAGLHLAGLHPADHVLGYPDDVP